MSDTIEKLKDERTKAMNRARMLEPDPGSGDARLVGPGAYDRGTAYGLTQAINALLAPSEDHEG